MNMLDLFSGIGGFAVSAKWALGKKVNVVGFCEIDEFCQTILKKHFPKVPIYDDVKIVNNKIIKRKIDIITGGFPCQDISLAGKGKGIEGERSGLWKEMYRIIGEFRPRWAIIENVSALTSRGLTVVLNDLAKAGYDAEWQCISAREVGARHKRERIWVVAYPSSLRLQCKKKDQELAWERPSKSSSRNGIQIEEDSLSESSVGRVVDGVSYWLHEPNVSRVQKEGFARKERIHSLGNSIVPQIPYIIFKKIKELEGL